MKNAIRFKLVLFTVIPIVLIYAVVFGYGFVEMQDRARGEVEHQMTELAWRYANLFDAHFREVAQIARSTATFMASVPGIDDASVYQQLRANLEQNPLVYGSAVAFAPFQRGKDRRLFSPYVYRTENGVESMDIAREGYDYTAARWAWWNIPRQTRKPAWTEPYLDEGAGNVYMVTYSVPFFVQGNFAGVATIDVRLRSLAFLVDREIAAERKFVIVTRTGRYVFAADEKRIGRGSLLEDIEQRQLGLEDLARAVTSGGYGVVEFSDPQTGQAQWAFFAPIKSTGWMFAARISKREALAPTQAQAVRILGALLLSLALIILAVWWVARQLTRPIAELNQAAQAIAAGNLETRVEVASHDEIGVLSRSFSEMAAKLARRERALCRARDELEERVAARTADLAEANLTLQREIEERRQADSALRKSEERFRILFEASSEANILVDESGILDCNQAFLDLFELTDKKAALGRFSYQFAPDRQPDGEPSRAYADRMLAIARESGHHRFDFVFRKLGGGEFPAEVMVNPVILDNKHARMSIIHDLTHRKRAEDEIVRARDAAEAANRAKSEFLSNMSHELRTPLNGVLGYAQILLRDSTVTPSQRESLNAIESCGQHLLTLINDVLDLSKIESGGLEIDGEPCDFPRLLEGVHDIVKPRADAKGLLLELSLASDIPRAVKVDATKLRQVLVNLLGNAVKFTEQGSVVLSVARVADERIRFEVRDTGVGIPRDRLGDIFDPFKQAQAGVEAGGTGLGLAISVRLVEAMGGSRMSVQSEPGKGSVFHFVIPLEELPEQVLSDEVAELAGDGHSLVLAPDQAVSVLVVDDRIENRDILRRLLESAGFDVGEAPNGASALKKLAQRRYHLVLMDIRMPVMDGLEATREIRRNPELKDTIVIAVTASVFPDFQARIAEAGCNDFIGKPIRAGEIFRAIERHLGVMYMTHEAPVDTGRAVAECRLDTHQAQAFAGRLRDAVDVGDIAALGMIADELARHPDAGSYGESADRLVKTFDFQGLEKLADVLQGLALE